MISAESSEKSLFLSAGRFTQGGSHRETDIGESVSMVTIKGVKVRMKVRVRARVRLTNDVIELKVSDLTLELGRKVIEV